MLLTPEFAVVEIAQQQQDFQGKRPTHDVCLVHLLPKHTVEDETNRQVAGQGGFQVAVEQPELLVLDGLFS